jgi:hypothetical protein
MFYGTYRHADTGEVVEVVRHEGGFVWFSDGLGGETYLSVADFIADYDPC